MKNPVVIDPSAANLDWRQWMTSFGVQVRRLREFLGLSQEQLARAAGASQGAVSRLEAGKGLHTPALILLRVQLALISGLRQVDRELLSDDARNLLDGGALRAPKIDMLGAAEAPVAREPQFERLLTIYRRVSPARRDAFLRVAEAMLSSLPEAPAQQPQQKTGT
jgi:transcriptional regulator with XRE-family HTH domain